jgi:Nuclease-related domain
MVHRTLDAQAVRRSRPPGLKALAFAADDSSVGYEVGKRAGGWVREQSARRARRIWVGLSFLFVVACGMVVLGVAHAISVVGSLLVLATFLFIRPHANAYVDRHVRLMRGTHAEEAVGDTLDELIRESWTVMHDIEQRYEGNIDHLASGPAGVFLIETKARWYEEPQLRKVKRQAAKVHDELGVWVTPVICLHYRDQQPRKTAGVWIVPHKHLLDWLRAQRNTAVSFERLARFADSL